MARHVLAWQCEYCGALKKSHYIAQRHEKSCIKNPNAKNCLICIHSYRDEGEVDSTGYLLCGVDDMLCNRARSAICDDFEKEEKE